MKNLELAQIIKTLRNRRGFSQEELSEQTGLSLRTIQRIENGETEPRGDSLKKLASVFDVAIDEITDWTVQEDKGFLISLNLSALSFIIFPLLGILVPLIIWISKKGKVQYINAIAKELLNFQITWVMTFFIGYIGVVIMTVYNIDRTGGFYATMFGNQLLIIMVFWGVMYLYNLISIIVNSVRINNNIKVRYQPQIRFFEEVDNHVGLQVLHS